MPQNLSRPLLLSVLFFALFLELSLITFWKGTFGDYLSPAVWLGANLSFCAAAWALLLSPKNAVIPLQENSKKKRRNQIAGFVTFTILAVIVGGRLSGIYAEFVIDPAVSDVLPSIQMYVRRFLSGAEVYAPLQFDGWAVTSTYFTMMWLPYIFSEIASIDYRWTAFAVFSGGLLPYVYRMSRQKMSLTELLLKIALPFLFLIIIANNNRTILGHSAELSPVGFYILLCFGMFARRRKLLFAVGIVCCLLSRYAFTFWLPLTLLLYWAEYGFKDFLHLSTYVFIGVTALYIVPFLLPDPDILFKGIDYYEKASLGEWQTQPYQKPGEKPFHLFQGMSFAAYIYDNAAGDTFTRMKTARAVHACASAGAALLLAAGYFLLKKYRPTASIRLYILVGLKFYVAFFYGFIYLPYMYLYLLPLFLGTAVVYEIKMSSFGIKNAL